VICFELEFGVKVKALSEFRSGVDGVEVSRGTVIPRSLPLGGVLGQSHACSWGSNMTDLEARRSDLLRIDDNGERLRR
jgi:hypothetical protein